MHLNLYNLRTSLQCFARRRTLIILLLLSNVLSHVASAASSPLDIDSHDDRDRLLRPRDLDIPTPTTTELHKADFVGHERRAPDVNVQAQQTSLSNNAAVNINIVPGQHIPYVFPKSLKPRTYGEEAEVDDLQLKHEDEDATLHTDLTERQAGRQRTVYISINTCVQPEFKNKDDQRNPPQLTLSVSDSNNVQSSSNRPIVTSAFQGYVAYKIRTDGDVDIVVSAPKNVEIEEDSSWNFEIAASVDTYYHGYGGIKMNISMIDSDTQAALLVTGNMTGARPHNETMNEWLKDGPPLSIFVTPLNYTKTNGLMYSFCGMNKNAPINGNKLDLTDNGIEFGLSNYRGPALEEQFYVPGLKPYSNYTAFLARSGNGTALGDIPGGGGSIITYVDFPTKLDANCQLIYNLTFCNWVAYAVPANPATYSSTTSLAALYDNTTQAAYKNFDYSLQQIPCNTSDSAKYSLARTCDDCAAAYKTWLCAVSIPRCEDFSTHVRSKPSDSFYHDDGIHDDRTNSAATDPGRSHLMPRNVAQAPIRAAPHIQPVTDAIELNWLATNSSRNNATIAGLVQPGPYLEVLPCEDLCFELVRSCPAALGFGCPLKGKGLESSYGKKGTVKTGGVSCSEPGAVFSFGAGGRVTVEFWRPVGIVVVVVAALVL